MIRQQRGYGRFPVAFEPPKRSTDSLYVGLASAWSGSECHYELIVRQERVIICKSLVGNFDSFEGPGGLGFVVSRPSHEVPSRRMKIDGLRFVVSHPSHKNKDVMP